MCNGLQPKEGESSMKIQQTKAKSTKILSAQSDSTEEDTSLGT